VKSVLKQFLVMFFEPTGFFLSLIVAILLGSFSVFGRPLWLWILSWFLIRVLVTGVILTYRWAKDGC
jgi:hypothetical protein